VSRNLAAAVKEIGKNVTGVQGDVANLGDLDRLFAQIKREKGKLDIVFANAGGALPLAPLGTITEENYDALFNSNVKGLLFTVQKALPLMPDGASIILNASIVASKGLPDWSVYSATKAAVRSFARTWTVDLKARRIRVNAVSPGFTDTPPWHSIEAAEEHMKIISSSVPLGRFGTTRRDRESRGVSRIRRQQLRHGNGIVCGWRLRASVGDTGSLQHSGAPRCSAGSNQLGRG